ncbi:MAG: PKD domain-containing protein [Bacteroidia bacterium]|nr:PKD domain-containing protein [Bacteroidia bacterium]
MKTFWKILVLSLVLISSGLQFARSQSYCPNTDFEMSSFVNWVGSTGSCCPVSVPTPGIVPRRHTIITAPGIDPNTCGGLQIMPAFVGNAVCRLGNDMTGSQSERLVYPLSVSSNNALFVYRYAVVLQDPGHAPGQQPNFGIRVLDQSGNIINPLCGQYWVEAGVGIPGFQSCGTVRWKDWTTVGIDLTAYIGQNVQIEFTTADCGLGAHFGYAYLDCWCMALNILAEYCIGANQVQLTAPPGFTYLWNTGATTQSITINNPVTGGQFTCQLTTVTGCNLTLTATLQPTTIFSGFTTSTIICGSQIQFTDTSLVLNGTLAQWSWNFGDGSPLGSGPNPIHTYASQGTYTVTLITSSVAGCMDTATIQVQINSLPVAAFSFTNPCETFPVVFTDQSSVNNASITQWYWDFGDASNSTLQNPSHTYSSVGPFNVTLIITSNNGCTDTVIQQITLTPSPVVSFVADVVSGCAPLCVQFSDSSVVTSGNITQWQWNFFDGSNYATQNPQHCFVQSGTYSISLTVTTNQGCVGTYTHPNYISVFPIPVAEFSWTPFKATILDTRVDFKDLSVVATQWTWDFGDGFGQSFLKNPSHQFPKNIPGVYPVTLFIVSPDGCLDTVQHNVEVIPIFTFYAPNVFTPNEDGINDTFIGIGEGIKDYTMYIFNRWGEMIYNTNSITEPWDGKVKNGSSREVQIDTYVWKILLNDIFDQKHEYIGHVSVLK